MPLKDLPLDLFMGQEMFKQFKYRAGVDGQKFQLCQQLDQAVTHTEKQIGEIAVQVVVDVQTARLGLHAQQHGAAAAEELHIGFDLRRKELHDERNQLLLSSHPGNERSSDAYHLHPHSLSGPLGMCP